MTILFGPGEGLESKRLAFESPYGCLWCGTAQDCHGRRWAPALSDTHTWEKPDQATILGRMLRRRSARLTPEPAKYHAATAWAADHTGESADPYCADCKTEVCHRWLRIQARLDEQRWGMPRRIRRRRTAAGSGWGDGEPPW
jgi:hypothetical protein